MDTAASAAAALQPSSSPPSSLPADADPTSAAAVAPLISSPDAVCNLRILMINGEDFRLSLPVASTIQHLKQKVLDDRPKAMVDFLNNATPSIPTWPTKVDEIRILHLGKFVDDAKTLKECNFAIGPDSLTTVHINVRVPANSSDDVKEKPNKKSWACCSVM